MGKSKNTSFNLSRAALPVLLMVLGLSTYAVISGTPLTFNSRASETVKTSGYSSVNYLCSDNYSGTINLQICTTKDVIYQLAKEACDNRSKCPTYDYGCKKTTILTASPQQSCSF